MVATFFTADLAASSVSKVTQASPEFWCVTGSFSNTSFVTLPHLAKIEASVSKSTHLGTFPINTSVKKKDLVTETDRELKINKYIYIYLALGLRRRLTVLILWGSSIRSLSRGASYIFVIHNS